MKRSLPVLLLAAVSLATAQDGVFRRASVTVKVASYERAVKAAGDAVRAMGGTVVDARREPGQKGQTHGWVRFAVPREKLDDFLAQLRSLGTPAGEVANTENQRRNADDLASRGKRLEEHSARLQSVLAAPRNLRGGDILFLQERVFRAQVDRDLLTSQREGVLRDSASSSVILTMFEPTLVKTAPPQARTATEKFSRGVAAGWGRFGDFFGRIAALLGLWLPWLMLWVPLAAVAGLFGRRVWRRMSRPIA